MASHLITNQNTFASNNTVIPAANTVLDWAASLLNTTMLDRGSELDLVSIGSCEGVCQADPRLD